MTPKNATTTTRTLTNVIRTFFPLDCLVCCLVIVIALAAASRPHNDIIGGGRQQQSAPQQPPGGRGCGSCRMREEIKTRNLEVIKSDVLRKMGFQKAPNVTGLSLPPVPQHFLNRIGLNAMIGGMQGDQAAEGPGLRITEEEDDYHARTQQVLAFAQPYPRLRHGWRHDILHFVFSDSITKYQVANATFSVFIKGTDHQQQRRSPPDVLIEVSKVYKDHPEIGLQRIATKKVTQPQGEGDWVKMDLGTTVSEWFKNPRGNFGFVVNATTTKGRKVAVTDTTVDNGTKAPYVVVSMLEARRRMRRNVNTCDEHKHEPLCCRYDLEVNFEDFGWDFIIAPKTYHAYFCSGECPMVTMQKYPHTHISTLAHPEAGQPCCAPRKLSPISMLYFDQQLNVLYGNLPGMVVERCGCS